MQEFFLKLLCVLLSANDMAALLPRAKLSLVVDCTISLQSGSSDLLRSNLGPVYPLFPRRLLVMFLVAVSPDRISTNTELFASGHLADVSMVWGSKIFGQRFKR